MMMIIMLLIELIKFAPLIFGSGKIAFSICHNVNVLQGMESV